LKPVLIGLTGKAKSGKSTLANELTSRHPVVELTFAQPLKDMGKVMGFKVDTQEDKQEVHPFWKISSRQFLQLWGTEIGRNVVPEIIPQMPSIWLQHMDMRLDKYYDEYNQLLVPIVISDVRFSDEAELIREYGGIIIHISRGNQDNTMTHSSEKGIHHSLIHYHITNDSSVENLYQTCMNIIEEIP
jgi:hypothetical protein